MNRLDEPGRAINLETGVLSPHNCRTLSCRWCVRVERERVARAAGAADPDASLTLTLTGDDIKETARRMDRVRKRLKVKGYPLEWVWVVECHKTEDGACRGHHVHALAHGNIPPVWVLSDVADRAGFGMDVKVKPVYDAGGAAGYLWMKRSKWRTLDQPHRLWSNGGRLQHSTHGYWRVDGERVAGWKEAARLTSSRGGCWR